MEGSLRGRPGNNQAGVLLDAAVESVAGACRGEGLDPIQKNKGMNGQTDGWNEKMKRRQAVCGDTHI